MHPPSRVALVVALATTLVFPAPARLAAQSAPPAPAADTLLRAAALQEDVRVLRTALSELHPGLHRYNTPAQVDSIFDDLARELSTDQPRRIAFLRIAEAMAGLQCGHTFPNPANQSRAVADVVFRATPRVPFYFRWLGGHMVVTRDASAGSPFPRGTEVLAIDGVPTDTILRRLLAYSRADGDNDAKRVANLELLPGERLQAFDVYFPLLFPHPAGPWRFDVRAPGGPARRVVAVPADLAQRTALYDSIGRARADTLPPWTLDVGGDGIAVLTMPTWVTYNDKWDWKGFVHRAFAEVTRRRARALVIDIRGNEGGTGVGDVILEHLVDRDLTLDQFQRYTRYRRIPDALRPYLDTWDRSFDDWGAFAQPAPDRSGFFRLTRYDDNTASGTAGTVIHPAAPRFTGSVYVLVGAANSSATFEFAMAVRASRLGTLVGQPTGGNQRGINGGAFYFLRLPNSRIEVDLPLIAQFPAGDRPNGGIAPDVAVRVTAGDVAAGRDPEMAAVRRLVARRRAATTSSSTATPR